jgi:hypothetical protein
MLKYFLSLVLIFTSTFLSAQYNVNYSIRIDRGFDSLNYVWVAGMNNPEFSEVDLNNDNILDLFVFDKSDFSIHTFINKGSPNQIDYIYAPQYENHFPKLFNWVLLLDFNCDGVEDIFCSTTLGIKVYMGYYSYDNFICFKLYKDLIYRNYQGTPQNLLVYPNDIPSFVDMNNDGDIDVITFDPSGGYLNYFENQSKETGFNCDSLYYELVDECWGDFYEPANKNAKNLDVPCPGVTPIIINNNEINNRSSERHTGSTTLCFDNNGDGVKEAFLGDISFTSICYLINDGTLTNAHIFDQDSLFPSYNIPSDLHYFPAAYRVDVNNDNKKDILMAPNSTDAENNFDACSWYYKNIYQSDSGIFQYQTDSFLIDQMIDVNYASVPVLFDYDNDGLKDILLSNYEYYDTTSFIAVLRNTGTATAPKYRLVKKNYLNLSALNKYGLRPAFGDLDNDGDLDLLIGNEDGTLIFYTNNASVGQAPQFVLSTMNYFLIDVGGVSVPQIIDLNLDGLLDIIVGRYDGKISYYENHGSPSIPDFTFLTSSALGGVGVGAPNSKGFIVPFITTLPNYTGRVLLAGNAQGDLELYDSIDNNLSGLFNLVTSNYSGISTNKRSSVFAGDINSDGVNELLIGNYRGGFQIYDTTSNGFSSIPCLTPSVTKNPFIKVYPNPAKDLVKVVVQYDNPISCSIQMFDLMGRRFNINPVLKSNSFEINTIDIPTGIYLLEIKQNEDYFVSKLLIER